MQFLPMIHAFMIWNNLDIKNFELIFAMGSFIDLTLAFSWTKLILKWVKLCTKSIKKVINIQFFFIIEFIFKVFSTLGIEKCLKSLISSRELFYWSFYDPKDNLNSAQKDSKVQVLDSKIAKSNFLYNFYLLLWLLFLVQWNIVSLWCNQLF